MKDNLNSLKLALALSALALISEVWRGFLDAMFVFPVDFGDPATMHATALVETALFAGWAWLLVLAGRGSRRALISVFALNAVIVLVIPIGWLSFYCPADCRASAGALFNLANTLNLILGILAGVALGLQLKPRSASALA